jgi:hypothetical protein
MTGVWPHMTGHGIWGHTGIWEYMTSYARSTSICHWHWPGRSRLSGFQIIGYTSIRYIYHWHRALYTTVVNFNNIVILVYTWNIPGIYHEYYSITASGMITGIRVILVSHRIMMAQWGPRARGRPARGKSRLRSWRLMSLTRSVSLTQWGVSHFQSCWWILRLAVMMAHQQIGQWALLILLRIYLWKIYLT